MSDAALDAGKRCARALGVLPRELKPLTELFLMPEDHPFSLERVAAIVKEDRPAAIRLFADQDRAGAHLPNPCKVRDVRVSCSA